MVGYMTRVLVALAVLVVSMLVGHYLGLYEHHIPGIWWFGYVTGGIVAVLLSWQSKEE